MTEGHGLSVLKPLKAESPATRKSLIYDTFGEPVTSLKIADRPLPPLAAGALRVAMIYAPVNPSDLIPVTGAYSHRIRLPEIAGYEGVGHVIDAAPGLENRIGERVLPLRGEGTWQSLVDVPAIYAVKVPRIIDDQTAARAYINPLAARTMLGLWPAGGKTVLLSGAGSSCANFLGGWARHLGASRVIGIYRSEARLARLLALGIEPISINDGAGIDEAAREADITFDALGGDIASRILGMMRETSVFVGYGLLTGQPIRISTRPSAVHARFHLREHLPPSAEGQMDKVFETIWPLLRDFDMAPAKVFPAHRWRDAIEHQSSPGASKPLLDLSAF